MVKFHHWNVHVLGWIVSPKKMNWNLNHWYLWMWSYLDIGSLQKWWSSDDGIGLDSNPMWLVSLQEEENTVWGQRHTGMTEAEIAVMQRQATELTVTLRNWKQGRMLSRHSWETWSCWYLDFGFLDSRAMSYLISGVLNHWVCGNFLSQAILKTSILKNFYFF